MTDTPAAGPNGGQEPQQASSFAINGQYIKDLSFESPNAPGILSELQSQQPDVKVNVDVQANKVDGGPEGASLYEVVLDINAELKLGERVGFIAELKYAGVFTLNVPEEHLGAMLLIECPRHLFPFARNILGDMTRDGGFVPLMLQPIDFAQMYQANMAQRSQNLQDEANSTIADIEQTIKDREGEA